MVRVPLDMCVPDLQNPTDIYADDKRRRLLLKKGAPLTEKTKQRLAQNAVHYLEFPLPFEKEAPPPFTFSEEIESSIFRLVQQTYRAFKKEAVENPLAIRKEAYDLITKVTEEFQTLYRLEHPVTDSPPRRDPRSTLHLRTIGALEDYLVEHAKNVCLTCVVLGFDYFQDPKQLLADLHKIGVAALFADIGMVKIPSRIVKNNTELSDTDWESIHKHPEISAQFVETLFRQKNFVTAKIVLEHHERGQGKGYPSKRLLPQVELHTRLLAVADSYHSMISKRYFRPAIHPIRAMLQINGDAGKTYDPRAVRALNYRIAPYPIGSIARFSDKKLIQVLELTNPPDDFQKVRLLTGDHFYNIPRTVRVFTTKDSSERFPKVSISGHLDKIAEPVDTFDLLALYGYVRRK